MKRSIILVISAFGLGAVVALVAIGNARLLFVVTVYAISLSLAIFVRKQHGAVEYFGPRRLARYQRRKTDAGNWVEAPVAELDKSTCGKLLASRLRREPGLHVVVRPETPRVCEDALYDPQLDG